jgi:DNA processing protein
LVAMLYVEGRLARGGLAIVGSRTPPQEAVDFAYELARRCGEPVISGLALGVDAAAHRGALAAGLPTVAFVGYGFGATYPPEHRELEREIIAAGGAVATECAPGTPVTDAALIRRDRLQAEHARAVVLIASELEGGAMHTVRFSRELGKPIYALNPQEERATLSQAYWGNLSALREGAVALPLDVDEALLIIRSADSTIASTRSANRASGSPKISGPDSTTSG